LKTVTPVIVSVVAALALFAACGDDDDAVPSPDTSTTPLPTASAALLTVVFEGADGEKPLQVELADSPDERYTGLRNRQSMDEDRGMLFAWPGTSASAFGMPETYIPLTIAFIREDGEIVHIEDMEPLTTDPHRSTEPYHYAVEANQGWFERNGITIGDIARVPEEASTNAR
jgi:uncharacterized membrane protein (UPF0127 family)